MNKYYTSKNEQNELFALLEKRQESTSEYIKKTVSDIIENVKANGDSAVKEYTLTFDKVSLDNFYITNEELSKIAYTLSPDMYEILEKAAANIRLYHQKQISNGYNMESDGKKLGRIVRPLRRVGIYVPGGTAAYPSTVLMNAIPASVAGVKEIVLITPPKAEGLNPMIAAAAKLAGVTEVITIGGAHGVAALAYGTESIKRVDKIVGPGNKFVAEAKRQVFGAVDIDMIAGPSEVCVIADGTANPKFIAADLLSQLEHDVCASATLVTTSEKIADEVSLEIIDQLNRLERKEIAEKSYESFMGIVITNSIEECFEIANIIAPEHLEISLERAENYLDLVENAGSIFLGEYTPEPMGDYFGGTNHVLPTSGSARFSSPLSVDDFVKKMSYLSYSKESFERDAEYVIKFADSEGLTAHANSVKVRLQNKKEN